MSNIPKLRFKEFDGALTINKLDKMGYFLKGSTLSKSDLSTDGKECILYGQLYTTYKEIISQVYSKTNVRFDGLVVGKINDVLIPSSGETSIDIATASCLQVNDVLLGSDLNVYRSNEINGIYLSYQLNSSKKRNMAKLAQGASIVHLYKDNLKHLEIAYPSLPEQEKIASFLSLFDEKIELQEKKVEYLKIYKKGMMQKIFSKEIRFKDENGEDYPEWEDEILGKICDITTGKLNANAMKEDGEFMFFTCSKESFKTDTYAFNGEALLIAGNGDVGNIKYFNGKFNAYQRTYVLQNFKCKTKYIKYYAETYLPKQIYLNTNIGAMPYIVLNVLSSMKVKMPNLKEQEKILKFLSTIEKKIELEQEKLKQLQEYKKGLLQQMFV